MASLLFLVLEGRAPPDDGRMSFVLSVFLAHTRQRTLSVTQLTALTELLIGQSKVPAILSFRKWTFTNNLKAWP